MLPRALRSRTCATVITSEPAHAMEHSLEVQVPFLQKTLGAFTLLPLAVGSASVAEVAQTIERLWGGDETLIVISTDLSHYHSYDEARAIDGRTLARIAACATDLDHEEACGATPLNGMLHLARAKALRSASSRRTTPATRQAAKAASSGTPPSRSTPGRELPRTRPGARCLRSLGLRLRRSWVRAMPRPTSDQGWLSQTAATFVTIQKEGKLRGCIGSLEAVRPLRDDIRENALAACFPRPALSRAERRRMAALLARSVAAVAPKTIRFADEADLLAQVRAGEDGIILEHAGKRATYLPQVWEGLPDKQRFFAELKRKAGIPPETGLGRCKVRRYRVAKWKETPLH
jgi:AmmeMemoRadiSam system protein A